MTRNVVSRNLVHLDLAFINFVARHANENGVPPLLASKEKFITTLYLHQASTHLTRIVSPPKSCNFSMVAVAEFNVATFETSSNDSSYRKRGAELTGIVVVCRLVDDKTIWPTNVETFKTNAFLVSSLNTYDFFCLKMAVDVSSGPGWGAAPLGSAIAANYEVLVTKVRG